jgi:beta-mannosidase
LQYKSYRPILNELDPNRPFRPCCSWGGKENTDPTIGDDHLTWWFRGAENIDTTWFDKVGRFASESALEGYPLPTSLRKFLAEEDILDDNSDVTDYHIKNNMYFEPAGLLSVHDRLKKTAEVIIGRSSNRYEDIYRLSYVQYEWARMVLEGARRSNWYCAGILYWMYNDCWPALGYAVVDYYGVPKAGWYATKNSAAPIAATIRPDGDDLRFIVLNNSFEGGELEYKVKLSCNDRYTYEVMNGRVNIKVNEITEILKAPKREFIENCGENAIIFLELYRDGKMISRARWYPGWLTDLKFSKAQLEVTVNREQNTVSVTCVKGTALGVAFDADAVFEDNYIDLLEGETAVIPYTALDGFDKIDVYGYNIDIVNGL